MARPDIGDVVLYRSRAGVDMPAIVTAHVVLDERSEHLTLFPPPGEAADVLSNDWGAERAAGDGEPGRRTWRPRPPAAAQ